MKVPEQSQFQPGVEVIVHRGGFRGDPGRIARVLRRYKNGNVVLDDGSKQQYRATHRSNSAYATGEGYNRPWIIISTPEGVAKMERAKAIQRLQRWKQSADVSEWTAAQVQHVLDAIDHAEREKCAAEMGEADRG